MPRSPALTREPLHVAAGILQDGSGRILISDRMRAADMRDYWEFPGGKRRAGEAAGDALQRELHEELGVDVTRYRHLRRISHDYADFSVRIDFYLVLAWEGTPRGREGQSLRWILPADADAARLLPADAPILEELLSRQAAGACGV